MTLADLRDMFAFIKTLPPVEGRVRDHDIRFPFNIRLALGGWKFLYLDGQRFTPDPNQPAEFESRRLSGERARPLRRVPQPAQRFSAASSKSKRFAGGPNPEGEGTIPNITQHALKDYSDKDILEILTTGMNPEGDNVGGSMAAVVRNTSQLPQSDRAAMAAYIKSLPPVQ